MKPITDAGAKWLPRCLFQFLQTVQHVVHQVLQVLVALAPVLVCLALHVRRLCLVQLRDLTAQKIQIGLQLRLVHVRRVPVCAEVDDVRHVRPSRI